MQSKLLLLLKQNNLTQHWLAELLKISDKQIGKKINGNVPFKSDEMFIIADYFNKKIEDIFLPRMYVNGTRNPR